MTKQEKRRKKRKRERIKDKPKKKDREKTNGTWDIKILKYFVFACTVPPMFLIRIIFLLIAFNAKINNDRFRIEIVIEFTPCEIIISFAIRILVLGHKFIKIWDKQ